MEHKYKSLSCKVALRWLSRSLTFAFPEVQIEPTVAPSDWKPTWSQRSCRCVSKRRCEERIHRFIGAWIIASLLSQPPQYEKLWSYRIVSRVRSGSIIYIHLQHPHISRWSCFTHFTQQFSILSWAQSLSIDSMPWTILLWIVPWTKFAVLNLNICELGTGFLADVSLEGLKFQNL